MRPHARVRKSPHCLMPEKMPSMMPSQRLPRLTSPLVMSPSCANYCMSMTVPFTSQIAMHSLQKSISYSPTLLDLGSKSILDRKERVPRPSAYSFLLPSSSRTTTHVLPHKLPKDALMGTRGCHTLPPHPAYAPTCESQKVPALPKKMPSMTPSQRLPILTSPLAMSPSCARSNTFVQRSHTASETTTT